MSKEKITIDVEIIKAALRNSDSFEGAALEVPNSVSAEDLRVRKPIYGIVINPINKKAPLKRSKSVALPGSYVAIKEIIVTSISAEEDDNFVVVNGSYKIREKSNDLITLKDAYFKDADDARQVCKVVTSLNLERLLELRDEIDKEVEFLRQQEENGNF